MAKESKDLSTRDQHGMGADLKIALLGTVASYACTSCSLYKLVLKSVQPCKMTHSFRLAAEDRGDITTCKLQGSRDLIEGHRVASSTYKVLSGCCQLSAPSRWVKCHTLTWSLLIVDRNTSISRLVYSICLATLLSLRLNGHL